MGKHGEQLKTRVRKHIMFISQEIEARAKAMLREGKAMNYVKRRSCLLYTSDAADE